MVHIDKTPKHIKLDEKKYVEEPFLETLEKLGWEVIRLKGKTEGNQLPEDSGRNNFSEVILETKLKEALVKINPFLEGEEDQIDEVIKRITQFSNKDLINANQRVLELLQENTSVSENRKTGEKSPTVKYIDFNHPENNIFTAISQLKVRILGTEHHIYPDITLFINGLPVVVVECKSPKEKDPINSAIDQLLRYSEQRGESKEGNKTLFYYNQFLVSTCRTQAKFGTISSRSEKHYFRWTDPYPRTLKDISEDERVPNDQMRLIYGMLDKSNLLSLIKTYTIFTENDKGQIIKVVARYQQFRAVKLICQRLLEGRNKQERSGIVWHTQGSGKSLTMMFTVREMYQHPKLQSWKMVFITDRTQLEDQLSKTGSKVGFTLKVAKNIAKLKELIKSTNSDLVMGMIHKFQERELNEVFPELNTSPNILIMTDEAHRSQYSILGANLDKAMPNATEIGFTGTPIDKTEKKYGDYIDKYTMKQAIDDGVTLEIVYEGRTHNAEVEDKEAMDAEFEDVFSDYKLEERMKILGYGTRDAYLEAKETIKAKAKDMIEHYVSEVFPNGFKAQIVAVSREAAYRYKLAIDEALKNKIKELKESNPNKINIDLLKKLETAVIISKGDQNDKKYLEEYTNERKHKEQIKRFKMSFNSEADGLDGNVGILIVNNMLLTGFDAPIEQVMYLDKVIKDHNLLQTIARVNRIGEEGKDCGFIVDYVGVGHHLKEALDNYDDREKKEILDSIKNIDTEINDLKLAHKEIMEFINKHGIKTLDDYDLFYDLFYDEDIRFEYIERFKKFTTALNKVFPKKEALDYMSDYSILTDINYQAMQHLRDKRFSMKGLPAKLRVIADHHLKSKGIKQKIKPISIIDDDFQKHVKKHKRTKTKAAEVEHAIRHYIDEHYDEDPELFTSFSESLEEILNSFKNNWEEIYKKLEELRRKILTKGDEPTYGLNKKKQMPFFRIIKKELFKDKNLSEDDISKLVNLTQLITNQIETEIKTPNFWNNPPAVSRLRAELQELLLSKDYSSLPDIVSKRKEIISRIIELAETKNEVLLYAE
jgi:type I restriction enzyme R subunit